MDVTPEFSPLYVLRLTDHVLHVRVSSSPSSHLPVTHGLMTVSSSMDCGNIDGDVAHHGDSSMEDHLSTFLGPPALTAVPALP